jgi:hypothetical protein
METNSTRAVQSFETYKAVTRKSEAAQNTCRYGFVVTTKVDRKMQPDATF